MSWKNPERGRELSMHMMHDCVYALNGKKIGFRSMLRHLVMSFKCYLNSTVFKWILKNITLHYIGKFFQEYLVSF